MTGRASRVAVCIGRKNPTTSASPIASARSLSRGQIDARDLGAGVAQPRRRRGEPERLAPHVVGRDEQNTASTSIRSARSPRAKPRSDRLRYAERA